MEGPQLMKGNNPLADVYILDGRTNGSNNSGTIIARIRTVAYRGEKPGGHFPVFWVGRSDMNTDEY